MNLSVPGLERWQHYKRRNPPWIKLYASLFTDYEFSKLSDAQKFHLVALWSLASRLENQLPNDPVWLSKQIGAHEVIDVEFFISEGFLIPQEKKVHNLSVVAGADTKQSTRDRTIGQDLQDTKWAE